MRLARRIDVNPYAHEYPPSFAAPLAMQNDKGIFRDQTRRLLTLDKALELPAGSRCHFEHRHEIPHIRLELTMGQVTRSYWARPDTTVVQLPANIPASRRDVAREVNLPKGDPRLGIQIH